MMVDSSKFNKVLAFTFGDLSDLDILVCEKKLPDPIMKKVKEAGVEII